MTLPQIISRNQIQKIPTITLNVRKVLSGGTDGDFYTVPTGKKALIKGVAVCTNTGAAANASLQFNGVSIATWFAAGGAQDNFNVFNLATDIEFPYEVQLDAGQVMRYVQNTGTNAEMNINAQILETPA